MTHLVRVAVFVVVGTLLVKGATAQNPVWNTPPGRYTTQYATPYGAFPQMAPSKEFVESQKRVDKARQLYADADNDEKKQEAQGKLRKALQDQFTLDIESRRAEFDKIKKRVDQLEERLETRVRKRDELVELQLSLIKNNADGLGWGNGYSSSPYNQYPTMQSQFVVGADPLPNGSWQGDSTGTASTIQGQPRVAPIHRDDPFAPQTNQNHDPFTQEKR
ncbi:hypothetical protein Mal64_12690 [Pseudobythopirellula maris]|uniref:Uncharacterized protein n=1 Tax=Pseudobythopirellula maris TaxID=2527991 RepID=A0A5C5ZVB5_9BACT|nr:hypothetical protein [Pseudobythopirellula maris]TWT90871.1 hypothetical protein Mal64_12690 [Pseudobythopirellula maris]